MNRWRYGAPRGGHACALENPDAVIGVDGNPRCVYFTAADGSCVFALVDGDCGVDADNASAHGAVAHIDDEIGASGNGNTDDDTSDSDDDIDAIDDFAFDDECGAIGVNGMSPSGRQCGVAPSDTDYAHGYTFIEGLMPAESFDALVRPERRLVLLVNGVPVAVDAAEVERAARVGRSLVTTLGSCSLGPLDAERARELDENLRGREGIRRALAPIPLGATFEALGAPVAEAAGGGAGALLGGILAALL